MTTKRTPVYITQAEAEQIVANLGFCISVSDISREPMGWADLGDELNPPLPKGTQLCAVCHGDGQIGLHNLSTDHGRISVPCFHCKGDGRVPVVESADDTLPQGTPPSITVIRHGDHHLIKDPHGILSGDSFPKATCADGTRLVDDAVLAEMCWECSARGVTVMSVLEGAPPAEKRRIVIRDCGAIYMLDSVDDVPLVEQLGAEVVSKVAFSHRMFGEFRAKAEAAGIEIVVIPE